MLIDTNHAASRIEQRGIPPMFISLLMQYGEKSHSGHDGIIRYFSKKSKKKMKYELGNSIINQLSRFMNIYLVHSRDEKVLITAGRRNKRIKDKYKSRSMRCSNI
jgi:hypothetical protein